LPWAGRSILNGLKNEMFFKVITNKVTRVKQQKAFILFFLNKIEENELELESLEGNKYLNSASLRQRKENCLAVNNIYRGYIDEAFSELKQLGLQYDYAK
jgi:ribosome assembly protein YihI (activator of Der GTPase)